MAETTKKLETAEELESYLCKLYDLYGKKYELSSKEEIPELDEKFYRIKALKNFTSHHGREVEIGDIGGFVEGEENLSQRGYSWIFDDAIVFEHAEAYGDSVVEGRAQVFGSAEIQDSARISEEAQVYDDAVVRSNGVVEGDGEVFGDAIVRKNGYVGNGTFIDKGTIGRKTTSKDSTI